MKVGLRILLGYFLIVGLAAVFLLTVFVEEVKPGVQSTLEDTLTDTANLLAEVVADDVARGRIADAAVLERVVAYTRRPAEIDIRGVRKSSFGYRIYITDANGIVLFDSTGRDVGADYSRWNDVWLTLRGKYGARSTREIADDDASTVMYVAAPIRSKDRIIGVLTVAKPIASVQSFVERSQRAILSSGAVLLMLSLAIGLAVTWWLSRALSRLTAYIAEVEAGRKTALPDLGDNEMGILARALDRMRRKLDGKEYVEEVMHTLTHELKSPIAAIQGSAELLQEDMPQEERERFLGNILSQNARQQQLIDKMLALVRVEKQQHLGAHDAVAVRALLAQAGADCAARLARRGVQLETEATDDTLQGDPLLLRQALGNMLDNAIDFAPPGSSVRLRAERQGDRLRVSVEDSGPGVPDYAEARVFERFYSLPRPDGAKSTGLGLPFVREVATLHGGTAALANGEEGGAVATLDLPLAASHTAHHQRTRAFYTGAVQQGDPVMQKKLFAKFLIVGGVMLISFFALLLVSATIAERKSYRAEAVRSIATDSVGRQTLTGPLLVIPYIEEYDEQQAASDGRPAGVVRRQVARQHLVFPNELSIRGGIDPDRRYRGIHQVLVYTGRYKIDGDFVLPGTDELPRAAASSTVKPGAAYLTLAVDDVRGIVSLPRMKWAERGIEFQQGPGLEMFRGGVHAPVGALGAAGERVAFSLDLELDGIEQMDFVPVAKSNRVTLKSPWPHPQFNGRFLPGARNRTIGPEGFSANWSISSLASSAQQQLLAMHRTGKPEPELEHFGVGLVDPVNVYSQADRATKYGLLFVVLTFTAIFMFELLRGLRIHPVQYLLVGLALAIFFLLLVSLSEHVDFLLAYLAAAVACIGLIAFYLGHVLGSRRRGLTVAAGLTLLYAVLYGLLQSENNALVMGSILLFAVLSAIMIVTRRVDWYKLGEERPGTTPAGEGAVQFHDN